MKQQFKRFRVRTVSAVVAMAFVANAWAVDPFTVRDIRIEGLQRVARVVGTGGTEGEEEAREQGRVGELLRVEEQAREERMRTGRRERRRVESARTLRRVQEIGPRPGVR